MRILLLCSFFLLSISTFSQGCGGLFIDNGGPSGNYQNNSNESFTICPSNPGDQVHVNFSGFDVEANNDGLYVFDGNSTSAPQISSPNPAGNIPGGLPGAFWGNVNPPPFISSSPNGCLTFQFISNGTITSSGWVASVYCAPPAECTSPISNLSVSNITATSAVLSWSTTMAMQWQVLAVPCGSPMPTDATSGMMVSANPFVLTGLTPGVCYDFYVRAFCDPIFDFSPWTGPVSATTLGGVAIGLEAFLDQNANGVKDSGEPVANYGDFVVQQNNSGANQFIDVDNGGFSFQVDDLATTFDLSYAIDSDLASYFSCATTYSDVSVAAGSGLTTFYFPIQIVTPFNDVSVHIIALSNPQPGFTYQNIIIYKNLGLFPASGTIAFTKDPALSTSSISEPDAITTSSGFSYSFADLQPNESRTINVVFSVPTIPTISLGTILTNSVVISPSTADINSQNNSFSLSRIVQGSYDPNDISESHGPEIVHSAFSANDYLYYTIRFQNTGTANATTVRIEDLLSDKLDFATVQMIQASHDFTLTRLNGQLTWQFDDIQLVPESVNSAASQGYVLFKVKPVSGFEIGDVIANTAEIYFDFNPAIVTNPFETEFVSALSTGQFASNSFVLYPNPASHYVKIKFSSDSAYTSISITDMLGKSIKGSAVFSSDELAVDTSLLSKGLYILRVNFADGSESVQKLIIK